MGCNLQLFCIADATVSLQNTTIYVNEGIEANEELLCVILDTVGVLECDLTVTLSSMNYTARK